MSKPEPAAPPSPATVRVWRLVKEKHMDVAFDGEGARLYGGRWNSLGHRVVYTSHSLALAALETLVHLDTSLPLPRFVAIAVLIDPRDIETAVMRPTAYANESLFPDFTHTRQLGDTWLAEKRSLALAVPSTIVPQEKNLLLNPAHPRFSALVFESPVGFRVDPRLRP